MKTIAKTEGRIGESVVDAARRLFSRYGHAKTSVEEIAREAGISKATVYNHFRGKEQIVAAVVARERKILLGKLRLAAEKSVGPEEALTNVIRTRVREIQLLHKTYRTGREDYIRFMSVMSRAIEESRKDEEALLAEILRRGIGEGVFRPMGDLHLVADVLYSTVLAMTFPLFGVTSPSPAERLEGLVEIVMRGICADRRKTATGEEET